MSTRTAFLINLTGVVVNALFAVVGAGLAVSWIACGWCGCGAFVTGLDLWQERAA